MATTRPRSFDQDSDSGFALLEVVVAMVIFVLVSTGAVMATTSAVKATDSARSRVTAINLVQSDLEQARVQSAPASTSYVTSATGHSQQYTITRVVQSCPSSGEQQISVTATWSGSGTVRADTVIAC